MTPTVDGYIESAALSVQPTLRQLRQLIRSAAPKAEEKISYGMPHYVQHGRVAYFAAHKNHVGLYSLSPNPDQAKELKRYMSGKSTLQFPIGQPLPEEPIRRLIEARVRQNESG